MSDPNYELSALGLVSIAGLSSPDSMNVLCTQVGVAAEGVVKANKLVPLPVTLSLGRLKLAHGELKEELGSSQGDPSETKQADLGVDRAWGALRNGVRCWEAVPAPYNRDVEGVSLLAHLVYGEGMAFLKADYATEWSISGTRIASLEAAGPQRTLAALGLMPVFASLKAAQERYGQVLGVTAQTSQVEGPRIKEKMSACRAALKDYVLKVVAMADPDIEGSEALSEALLKPVAEWLESIPPRSSAPKPVEPPPAEVPAEEACEAS